MEWLVSRDLTGMYQGHNFSRDVASLIVHAVGLLAHAANHNRQSERHIIAETDPE